jgi:hypothetical protein
MFENLLVAAKPDIAMARLPSGMALLNMEKGKYYSLNKVGAVIWERLQTSPATMATLSEYVATTFQVTEDTCRGDIIAFLDMLRNADLLDMSPAATSP